MAVWSSPESSTPWVLAISLHLRSRVAPLPPARRCRHRKKFRLMSDDVTGVSDKTGLGTTPREDWPEVGEAELDEEPIDRLKPGSQLHKTVLEYLTNRIRFSERKMSAFIPRWRWNEARVQAFVT